MTITGDVDVNGTSAAAAATNHVETTISPEVVNKINELIGMDRSLLTSDENANELVNKLRNKIDALRDNFVVSMPFELNNEGEFGKLCGKIESLADQYAALKTDHAKVRTLIDDYKRKSGSFSSTSTSSSSSSSSTSSLVGQHDEELRNLVAKHMSTQRYLIYVRTLIKLDEFR